MTESSHSYSSFKASYMPHSFPIGTFSSRQSREKSAVPNVSAEQETFLKVTVRLCWLKLSLSRPFPEPPCAWISQPAACVSPLYLPYLFAQPGEVLRELHHHDDEGPPCEHAGRPQQRVEEDAVVVQAGQEDSLLLLAGVIVTGHLLVHPQALWDVHDQDLHGHAVLLAPGHIETLQGQDWRSQRLLSGVQTFCSVDRVLSFLHFTALNAYPLMLHLSAWPGNIAKSHWLTLSKCGQSKSLIRPTSDCQCQHLQRFGNSQYFPSGAVLTSELMSWVSSLWDKRLTRPVLLTLT